MPPVNRSLSTTIETKVATHIFEAVGTTVNSLTNVDLDPAYRINKATGGFLLVEEDRKTGPLIRCAVEARIPGVYEIGNGSAGRSMISLYKFRVSGISAQYALLSDAKTAINELEDVVFKRLFGLDLSDLFSTDSFQNDSDYAAILQPGPDGTQLATDSSGTNTVNYVGIFTQSWQFTVDNRV